MKVFNINGTSDNDCKCGSWKAHWIKFSGKDWPTYCCEKSCTNPPTVGAHVEKVNGSNSWYIVPLCAKHNKATNEMELYGNPTLVTANRGLTCGY